MIRYVAGRLLEMVPVVVLVSVLAFLLIHLVPGDPARISLGVQATPQQVAEERSELGLDEPLLTQYWEFISGVVTFDFGTSIRGDEDVGSLIVRRAGPSFLLVGYTMALALLLAVPLAMIAAVRRGRWADRLIQVVPTVTFVMPSFWLALVLVSIFSLQLGLFPTSGYGETFPQHLESLTLPALTLALGVFPLLVRLLRSGLIETMGSEYVEAARARGFSETRVIFRHVLRNSVISMVTFVGILLGVLLSLTVIVEEIFAIPGLGSLLVSAVETRDFPVIQALTLLFALAVLVAGLLTDLAYAILDPRVRL